VVLIRHLGAPTSTPPYSSLGLGQLGMPHTQRVRMQVRDLHVKDLAPRLGSTDVTGDGLVRSSSPNRIDLRDGSQPSL
jgi:hypothetical protein